MPRVNFFFGSEVYLASERGNTIGNFSNLLNSFRFFALLLDKITSFDISNLYSIFVCFDMQ